ncbi:GNAT family N-acetyltransferase [Streptosporangium sp. KLBMP 9127]|nr:GNAT family N-acetyltransferase [Streptosporangium sp. KLBMP 9127]
MLGTQVRPADVVEIRLAGPGDEERVRSFLCGLSLATATSRFFAGMTRPSPSVLRSLLLLDARRDVLLAVLPGTDTVIGHAMSFHAAPGSPVEIAVVVADEWQGLGYGSRLVGTLLGRAAARGARTVGMDVLGDNRRVLAMIRRRWPQATTRVASGTVEIETSF